MKKEKPISRAEHRFLDWMKGRSGSFVTALFELMGCSDAIDLARLEQGFPGEVGVWRRYKSEDRYWYNLNARYEKGDR